MTATQLVSHLSRDGAQNEFYSCCHASQRAAVFALLEHLLETRVEHFDDDTCLDQLSAALELWEPQNLFTIS